MGCWDITCALTNLPICEGDPIRLFLLRQPMYDDSEWGHPWTRWVPASFPIQGTYNMYGGIHEYEESAVLQFQVECIKRYAVRESVYRDEKFLDRGDEDFPNTMESLLSACERGFLKLNLPYTDWKDKEPAFKKVHTTMFVVHEEIYQHMIADSDRKLPGIGTMHGRLEKDPYSDKVKSLRNSVEWVAERAERVKVLERLKESHPDLDLFDEVHRIGLRGGLTSHMDGTPDVLVVGNAHDSVNVEDWPALFKFTDEDWAELRQRLHEQDVFFWTMKELRREFHPAQYTDQYWYPDNNLDGNRLLAHYVDKMTVALQKKGQREQEENP